MKSETLQVGCPHCGRANAVRAQYRTGSRQFKLYRGRREVTYGALRGLPVDCAGCSGAFNLRARRVPSGLRIEASARGTVTRITETKPAE